METPSVTCNMTESPSGKWKKSKRFHFPDDNSVMLQVTGGQESLWTAMTVSYTPNNFMGYLGNSVL